MSAKSDRKAELERQYAEALKKIEEEVEDGDDEDDNDDVIVLRGNAKKEFMAQLKSLGVSNAEAKDAADEVEDELDEDGNPIPKAEEEAKPTKGKPKSKEKPVEDESEDKDPKPPTRHRFFN